MHTRFLHSRLTRRMLLSSGVALCAATLLTGCNDATPVFKGSDISGTRIGRDWTLTGMDGKTYTLQSFAGKVVLVLFGFTQCPDVCPTSLAELAQVMKLLGSQAERVQVLMISVDPERDTPEVLRAYISGFDPAFMGLTGSPEQVKQAAASFKAFYAKAPTANGGYNMDHSASFYLLDPTGEARVLLANNVGAETIAQDIRTLLR